MSCSSPFYFNSFLLSGVVVEQVLRHMIKRGLLARCKRRMCLWRLLIALFVIALLCAVGSQPLPAQVPTPCPGISHAPLL